jgi:hypothetical protein
MVTQLRPADFVRSFAERGDDGYDDVHVDQLADPPSGPGEWISAAIAVLAEAVSTRDQLRLPATVAMEVFLAMQESRTGVDFRKVSDLTNQLGWTPPQLVLCGAAMTPDWTDENFCEVTAVAGLPPALRVRVLLQEWRSDEEAGQFDRRVWFVAPPKMSP